MRCPDCGTEMNESSRTCAECEKEPKVTVLDPRERESFQGVTIHQDNDGPQDSSRYSQSDTNQRVYIRHVHVSGGSFWSRLLIALAIMAFLAALVFVALPVFLIVIAVVTVISFVIRMLR